jgi:aminopeptidase
MHDPRIDQLARTLVRYSTQVKKGDRVWIDCFDVPGYVAVALIRAVVEAKGLPIVKLHDATVSRELIRNASEEQYDILAKNNLDLMKETDCYIAVRGSLNITENSDVPADKMKMVQQILRPLLNERVNNTRWCVLRWPSSSMAQQALNQSGKGRMARREKGQLDRISATILLQGFMERRTGRK